MLNSNNMPADCWFVANCLFLNASQKVKDQGFKKEKIGRKKHV